MAEQIISDYLGNPIARFSTVGSKTVVTDWLGNPLGTADVNGTYDNLGKPISHQNVPGLLVKGGK